MSGSVCEGFVPQACPSFINCTGSQFIPNWTDVCCQPESVKDTRYWMLSIVGVVGIAGTICNIITISTFVYLYFFSARIKKKFGLEFGLTKDPVFLLILHLSFCDLLYCVSGLPTYWDVYYNGYYPHSHDMCKYTAVFRNTIGYIRVYIYMNLHLFCSAYADFNTIALISAYFAWRRRRVESCHPRHGSKIVLGMILGIWIYSFCITCIPLLGLCGQLGYDPIHGKCKVISCESCSEESWLSAPPVGIELAISIGVPSVVIFVSYTIVYTSLAQVPADMDTKNLRKSVLIVTICYFLFIVPLLILEWLPADTSDKAIIGVIIYSWYWCIYVINFIVYIIFWRRARIGIQIFLKDLLGLAGIQKITSSESNDQSSVWWKELQKLDK